MRKCKSRVRAYQLELFAWLPRTCRMRQRRKCALRRVACAMALWRQLDIDLRINYLEDGEQDDALIDSPIVQRVVSAAEAEPVGGVGPCSVFQLGTMPVMMRIKQVSTAPVLTRIIRDGDTVRCVRMLPQETDEWREKEMIRRAKQRPPKPKGRAVTVGDKMRATLEAGRP